MAQRPTSLLEKVLNGKSSLSTNGEQPQITTTAGENDLLTLLEGSDLHLNGETPPKYADRAPEGQSGRI